MRIMSLCRKEQPLTLEINRKMVETTFYPGYADGLHESKRVLTGLALLSRTIQNRLPKKPLSNTVTQGLFSIRDDRTQCG